MRKALVCLDLPTSSPGCSRFSNQEDPEDEVGDLQVTGHVTLIPCGREMSNKVGLGAEIVPVRGRGGVGQVGLPFERDGDASCLAYFSLMACRATH